jgi:hypothetical protein
VLFESHGTSSSPTYPADVSGSGRNSDTFETSDRESRTADERIPEGLLVEGEGLSGAKVRGGFIEASEGLRVPGQSVECQ